MPQKLFSILIIIALGFVPVAVQAQTFKADSLLKEQFPHGVGISGIAMHKGKIFLLSERCSKIYELSASIDSFMISGISKGFELEGMAVYKGIIYVIDEAKSKVYKLDWPAGGAREFTARELKIPRPLPERKGDGPGIESIAVNEAKGLFYFLTEKNPESRSTLYTYKIFPADSLAFDKEETISLPDTSWRFSDAYYDQRNSRLVLLRTSREHGYFIDTISMHPSTGYASGTAHAVASIGTYTSNLNLEGIAVDSTGAFYIASDNAEGNQCAQPPTDKVTLVMKLSTVQSPGTAVSATNPPVRFEQTKMEVWEKSTATDHEIKLKFDDMPDGLDSAFVVDSKDGDASKADYRLETGSDRVKIYFSKGSPFTQSVKFTVLSDNKSDDKEEAKLYLFHGSNKTPVDSIKIIIRDVATEDIFLGKSLGLNGAEYRIYLEENSLNPSVRVCKGSEINTANCKVRQVEKDISKDEFLTTVEGLYREVSSSSGTQDLASVRSKAEILFTEWKGGVARRELKNEVKSLEGKIQALQEDKAASASAQISAGLDKKIPLYKRQFLNSRGDTFSISMKEPEDSFQEKLQRLVDSGYNRYRYQSSKDSIIFDSVSIRIENGYITSVVLVPSHGDVVTYNLNGKTVIRRAIDLRSPREATEDINFFLPLESNEKIFKTGRALKKISKTLKVDRISRLEKKLRLGNLGPNKAQEPARNNLYSDLYVNLSDIIGYNPNMDSTGDVIMHVKNINATFSRASPRKLLLYDKDFNSFAQLNIYTDLIGLFEDKPNGLMQTEGKFETGIFTQPLFNGTYYSRVKWRVLPSASITVSMTKIEDKDKYLIVPKDSVRTLKPASLDYDTFALRQKNLNTLKLLQFGSLDITTRFDLVDVQSDYGHYKLYVGVGLIRTPVNDTTIGYNAAGAEIVSENKATANSLKTLAGIKLKLKSTSNLGLEIGFELIKLRFNNTEILQTYNRYNRDSKTSTLRQIRPGNVFSCHILAPNLSIYYFLDREQQKRMFLRAQYFTHRESRIDDYMTMQFGYSTDLSGFFKLFKKQEEEKKPSSIPDGIGKPLE
jgi:uncharacterized protein YjiK